jgi:hypothetical protein
VSPTLPAPTVPVPDGWRVVSDEVTTPFDAFFVVVRARTVLLEDASMRERIAEATGADATWRFFFASRLRLTPPPPPSPVTTRLVARRANDGFREALREKGFAGVRTEGSRRFAVRGREADLTRYRARVVVRQNPTARRGSFGDECSVAVDGSLAAWPAGREFLLAGGAYPREVEAGPDELAELVDPQRFRNELFEMIRETR